MGNPAVSLSDVFSLRSTEGLERIRERMAKEIGGAKWTASLPDVVEKVAGLFNIEIPDIMMFAWKKVSDLKKSLDRSTQAPEETIFVELADHTITSEHHPCVDVEVNGVAVKKLEFTVKLSLTLKGFILRIQNGRVKEIQTGTCEGKGTIAYGDLEFAEKTLAPIKLPGSIDLGEGVALAA